MGKWGRCARVSFLIALLLFVGGQERTVYVASGNIFDGVFGESFERLAIILYNGDFYSITTRDEFRIRVDAGYICEYLKDNGQDISDVVIMIHNHFARFGFSGADKLCYKQLVDKGFNGRFFIVHTPTGRFKEWDGEKEVSVDSNFKK